MRPNAPGRRVTARTGRPSPQPSPFQGKGGTTARITAASVAGFTSAERAGVQGGAPLAPPCSKKLYSREEVADLEARGFRRVRPVDAVGLDRRGEVTADRARGGLGGVGRAHDLPQARDRILALEHQGDAGPGAHEVAQAPEEGPLAVHMVEALGLGTREPAQTQGDDF